MSNITNVRRNIYAHGMDALYMQALLIRRDAAIPLLKEYDEEGRWQLLFMILDPEEAVLEASLQMAEASGPTKLAVEMSVRAASEKARRRTFSLA